MTRVDVVTRTLPPNEVSEANPWDTDRFWTVPNVLSVIRLIGVPIFLWLALGPRADGWAVAVLAVAGLTDWLDGRIARRWHQVSRIGQMLDPVADRLYIFATVIALTLRDVIPLWLVIVLIARDVCMACLMPALRTRGFTSLPVHFVGKAATFACCTPSRWCYLGASVPVDGRRVGCWDGPSRYGGQVSTGGLSSST